MTVSMIKMTHPRLPAEVPGFVGEFIYAPDMEELRSKLCETLANSDRLRVGSMFSGWGVLEMVLAQLEMMWNFECSYRHKFQVGVTV